MWIECTIGLYRENKAPSDDKFYYENPTTEDIDIKTRMQ